MCTRIVAKLAVTREDGQLISKRCIKSDASEAILRRVVTTMRQREGCTLPSENNSYRSLWCFVTKTKMVAIQGPLNQAEFCYLPYVASVIRSEVVGTLLTCLIA
jgi:hypothetical protein